jgi:hypothetical protein
MSYYEKIDYYGHTIILFPGICYTHYYARIEYNGIGLIEKEDLIDGYCAKIDVPPETQVKESIAGARENALDYAKSRIVIDRIMPEAVALAMTKCPDDPLKWIREAIKEHKL